MMINQETEGETVVLRVVQKKSDVEGGGGEGVDWRENRAGKGGR